MTIDALKDWHKPCLNEWIDTHSHGVDTQLAFASGMMSILSALRSFDSNTLTLRIAIMHSALHEVAEARGWRMGRVEASHP